MEGADRKFVDSAVCEARRAADWARDAIAERRVQVLPQPFGAFQANVVAVPARQRTRVREQHEAHRTGKLILEVFGEHFGGAQARARISSVSAPAAPPSKFIAGKSRFRQLLRCLPSISATFEMPFQLWPLLKSPNLNGWRSRAFSTKDGLRGDGCGGGSRRGCRGRCSWRRWLERWWRRPGWRPRWRSWRPWGLWRRAAGRGTS